MSAEVRAAALAACRANLSVIPIRQNGSKKPALASWKRYQSAPVTEDEVNGWFEGCDGIALVCGYDHLEVIDFDDMASYAAFRELANATDLGGLLERVGAGYFELTPNGAHLAYRSEAVGGNTKLARRPKRPEEMEHPDDKVKVLIETRGVGGYCIVAPSNGRTHPSGRPYTLLAGGFDRIVTITAEERESLLDAARSLDEMPKPEHEPPRGRPDAGGTRPGDDFNARATWPEVLEPHGWRAVFTTAAGVTHWRRPGKAEGTSATTNWQGSDLLYIFSTSTDFEAERGYSKFAAYAVLDHGGDFAAAARALDKGGYGERQGYRERPKASLDGVDPAPLEDVLNVYRRWLHLPDGGHVEIAFAAALANYGHGDPVWLLLVGPPSSGKTEPLTAMCGLPHIHRAAAITEAALLSGTPKREKGQDATGGLLRQIGELGILVCKDFGSVIAMNRDSRSQVLAALREVYDGAWTRNVGSDGGRTLHWEGKCGFVGGATPAIDGAYAVMASLGERFLFYRLPEDDGQQRAEVALKVAGREQQMRAELAEATRRLFAGLHYEGGAPELSDGERDKLVALATLCTRGRSAVERDGYLREIVNIPGAESPTRVVKALALLFGALLALGVPRLRAWQRIEKVVLDSMPAIRYRVLSHLLAQPEGNAQAGREATRGMALELGYPTSTMRRSLEDLTAYGLAHRYGVEGSGGDDWSASELARDLHARASRVPEIPG